MLTNLGEWAAARNAPRPLAPSDLSVVIDWPGRVWTVLAQRAPAYGDRTVLGWIYRLGTDFEVTTAGDPVLVVRIASFDECLNFLMVDASAARPERPSVRGVG
jgi:hypothetical protein